VKITVIGSPRTKKNHSTVSTVGGHVRVLPSKPWSEWCKYAGIKVDGNALVGELLMGKGVRRWSPLTTDYNVKALFYRDRDIGDAVGYYQGLADLLEKRGVLRDDKQIRSWDGSRLLVDRANPRVEIELEAA
jgi:hypothetical protein